MTNLQKNIIDAIEDAEGILNTKHIIEGVKEEGKNYRVVADDNYITLLHGNSECAKVVNTTRIRIIMEMFEAYIK